MRVALCTIGSLGDLHPFLGVGRALSERGHAVTVATSPIYEDRVRHAGLDFRPVGPDFRPDDPEVLDAVLDRWRSAERLHTEFVFPWLRSSVHELEPLARESDLVVRSVLGYGASIAAECAGTPWAGMQLSPLCMWSALDPPVLAPVPWLARLPLGPRVHRALMRAALRVAQRWARPVRELRRERGLPDRGNPFFEEQFAGVGTVAAFSRWFAPPQPDWPARTVQTGFVFHEEAATLGDDLRRFLAAGEPPVVFTLGSTSVHDPGPALQRMVEAARGTGLRCVVLVGEGRIADFAPRATERVHVAGYAPYAELFPHARAVVHQGGVGTTAQVMRAGCAQLVTPHCNDQFDNASRVERAGVGRSIVARRATAGRMRDAARGVAEDASMAARAAELGARVRAEDGAGAAAAAIEGFVEDAGAEAGRGGPSNAPSAIA